MVWETKIVGTHLFLTIGYLFFQLYFLSRYSSLWPPRFYYFLDNHRANYIHIKNYNSFLTEDTLDTLFLASRYFIFMTDNKDHIIIII